MKLSNAKKIIIIVSSVIFVIIIGVCIYVYSLLSYIKQTDITPSSTVKPEVAQQSTVPDEQVPSPDTKRQEEEYKGITNIVLFGLDRRGTEASRSDTIMITTIDGNSKKIKLASLMRDMYVKIPGKQDNRINAAYAFGGPGLAIDTINSNFNMDIKYYITVDFKGLQRLINKVGGVDIYIKEGEIENLNENISELNYIDSEEKESLITSPGMQHLTGKQAVGYMRIRHYGDGDYERTQRQRTVMVQLYDKIKKAGIFKLPELITLFLPYVETNMPKIEIIKLCTSCLGFQSDIEQLRIPVDGTFYDENIRGMAVLVPNIDANTQKLHDFVYGRKDNIASTP